MREIVTHKVNGANEALVVDTDDDLAVAGLAIDRTDIAMPTLDRKRALAAEVLAMATRLRC